MAKPTTHQVYSSKNKTLTSVDPLTGKKKVTIAGQPQTILTGAERSARNNALKGTVQTNQVRDVQTGVTAITPVSQVGKRDMNGTSVVNQGNYQQQGLFYNKAGGYYTDKSGTKIDPATGKPFADQKETPLATYADIGKANLAAETNALNDFGLDLGLEGDQFLAPLDEAKRQIQLNREAKLAQEAQLAEQQAQLEYGTAETRKGIAGGLEAAQGQLTGSREGVTSGSNASALEKYKTASQTQIDRLIASQDASNAALDQARVNLAEAERSGNQEVIQNARNTLLAAEQDAMATETAYVNALSSQATTENAVTQSGLTLFQNAVGTGNEMDYNTVKGYADQLGLPTDLLMGYYQGAQAIRDDKTLSLEDKQIALDQAKQDLQDQITGMDTQAAQAIKGLQTLRQQGASEDVIAAYKQAAGITDYDDPLTKAKLAYDNAQAAIAYNEANGIITSPLDMIDLAQKTYDYYSQIGYTAGAIPTGGEYGASSYTLDNGLPAIMVNVQQGQSLDLPETRDRDEGQCGAFVNDFFGERMMGNLFTEKMGLVDKSIQVPEPGMAFVMETESEYGHTGIVEYVDPSRGVMGIVDANWNNDGKVRRTEIPISDAAGFVRPPNAVGAGAKLEELPAEDQKAVKEQMASFNSNKTVQNFNTSKEGFDFLSGIDINTSNPADDIAMIYSLAKALDPDSVVREGEYATVSKYVQNWADQFGFDAKRTFSNTVFLTPEARQSIVDTVSGRFEASRENYNRVRDSFVQTLTDVYGVPNADAYFIDYDVQNPETGTATSKEAEEDDYTTSLVDFVKNADIYNYAAELRGGGQQNIRTGGLGTIK